MRSTLSSKLATRDPVTPVGINLANDQSVREEYGSKSVSLSNVVEAYDRSSPGAYQREFAWDEAEAARSERWGSFAGELHTNMHEVIGHASGQLEDRDRDGKTFYVMTDPEAFRSGVGELLAEVQRIKSQGDYEAAKALFENYGIHFDPDLRDQVLERVALVDLPSYSAFVMPKLEGVRGSEGEIVDVTISYPGDLMQQMLEYSGKR